MGKNVSFRVFDHILAYGVISDIFGSDFILVSREISLDNNFIIKKVTEMKLLTVIFSPQKNFIKMLLSSFIPVTFELIK